MAKLLVLLTFMGIYCLSIAPASIQGIQCYSCRGINCLRTTIQTKFETCEDNLDSCAIIFDKFAVVAKGCLMNIPVELRKKCDNTNNPECQVCAGGLCNNKGRIDFKCYQCDERDQDGRKCADDLTALNPIQCPMPTAPNSYCYTKTYKGATVRGCSLHVKDQLECLADDACSLCLAEDGEGCNSRELTTSGVGKISLSGLALVLLFASMTRAVVKFY